MSNHAAWLYDLGLLVCLYERVTLGAGISEGFSRAEAGPGTTNQSPAQIWHYGEGGS